MLIHLLDGAAADPLADWKAINSELALFSPELALKPQVVALNKIDLTQAQHAWPKLEAALKSQGFSVFAVSAATGQGTRELLRAVQQRLDSLPAPAARDVQAKVFRPAEDDDAFEVIWEGEHFRIRGRRIERVAVMTDWGSREALARFQRILAATGIMQALQQAGVEPGDTVLVGQHELEWQ